MALMRYRLRTLLMLLTVGPPAIALLWRLGLLPIGATLAVYAVLFGLATRIGRVTCGNT